VPYVRLSIVKPLRGQEAHLEELMKKLAALSRGQEGCIECFLLRPHDDSGEIARIAVYSDEHAAENAANSDSFLALRSEVHLAAEPGHVERAFFSLD
jgi:quinol monooxygenase YgiN